MRYAELTEKWSKKYKSSINCNNPKGFSEKAHCAGKKKNESIERTITDQDLQQLEYENLIKNIKGFAGGGIAKLAGDRSGPPPEKGPMSQGLRGLLKRGKKI